MENVLRTLIWVEQVSLTLVDATEIVNEAIRLHGLFRPAALVLGKTLSVMTFMSACLKEETGEVSVSLKGNGRGGKLSVSGNYALRIRGYIDCPQAVTEGGDEEAECLGSEGSLTIIRDDGYSRPFVGACALNSSGSVERAFEEYYRISEQLPTHIAASIGFTPEGTCAYAGTVVLQPLPFADEETLKKLPARKRLEEIAASVKALGLEKAAEIYFSAKSAGLNLRKAEYKCNCSKEYLSGVLVSLGKDQLKDILREDGEIKVHCHYCNKDYRFTEEDVEKMFP